MSIGTGVKHDYSNMARKLNRSSLCDVHHFITRPDSRKKMINKKQNKKIKLYFHNVQLTNYIVISL